MNLYNVIFGLLTENIIILGILIMMLFEMLRLNSKCSLSITFLTLIAVVFSLCLSDSNPSYAAHYVNDKTTNILKACLVLLAFPCLVIWRSHFFNYKSQTLFLSAILGSFLMISAQSFLTLFIGLELLALPTYVLVFLGKQNNNSSEAALKYLILGSCSSAIMLLSSIFLFQSTQQFSLLNMTQISFETTRSNEIFMMLFFIAFFFKTALVPFHQWAPDVYDGADLGITAYMSAFIKGAYLFALGKIFMSVETSKLMLILCGVIPLISILWGNIAAIRQTSFPRLMAYSSIAHAAYIYYAFIGKTPERLSSIIFYVLSYGLIVIAIFGILNYLSEDLREIKNFQGLAKKHPWAATIISICLLSLAGLPPFPGFFAKFYIFKNVVAAGNTSLATIAFLASFIGIYFYIRLIVLMYMSEKEEQITVHRPRVSLGVAVFSILLLIPGVWLTNLMMK